MSLALGGILYLCGDEDREPLLIPGYQSEYMAGLHGYGGLMMALWERDADGIGSPDRGLGDRVAGRAAPVYLCDAHLRRAGAT